MNLTPGARKEYTLVVDCNCFRGRGLASALTRLGCYAAFVPTGDAALRYIIENEPDAVIADWELPDMDGLELARQVTLGGLRTKVILHKEDADWRCLRSALECGGEEVLTHPCSADVVLRALERRHAPPHERYRLLSEAGVA